MTKSDSEAVEAQWEVTLDEELGIAVARVVGPVRLALAKAIMTKIWSLGPSYRACALWDLRRANTTALTREEVFAIRQWVKENRPWDTPGKAAYLVGSEVDFGVGRMVELTTGDDPVRMAVFRALDDAKAWLLDS